MRCGHADDLPRVWACHSSSEVKRSPVPPITGPDTGGTETRANQPPALTRAGWLQPPTHRGRTHSVRDLILDLESRPTLPRGGRCSADMQRALVAA